MTSRAVLVLGRFRADRKAVLDHVGHLLERHGYRYLVFDFAEPGDRNKIETIGLLAGLSRFVVADITEPTSVALELAVIVSQLNIPVVLLAQKGKPTFSLPGDLRGATRPACSRPGSTAPWNTSRHASRTWSFDAPRGG